MNKPKNHRFVAHPKGGRKGRKGQTKGIRVGSRHPGKTGGASNGSVRHPY